MQKWLIAAALAALVAVVLAAAWMGYIPLNHPGQEVRGVDVSHYQGDIDWPVLVAQGRLQFAYIKATEGSAGVDEYFEANWNGAREAGLRAGAYHFFSYDSPGADQAAHFIDTVPAVSGALPPAIDVEFYGDYDKSPAPVDAVVPQLQAMIDALTAHYGRAPVIYCTDRSYRLYVQGRFEDCGVWIRSVYGAPRRPLDWVFWQYDARARLKGYSGAEQFIDMDVFYGAPAQLETFALP